jgi:hypothetical protein
MLQRATVVPGTLSLLKDLMKLEALQDFYLVGGTALALQIGHRISEDLDFFLDGPLDHDKILEALPLDTIEKARRPIFYGVYINGIKCDFATNTFPRKLPLLEVEGIRMAQPLEIAAMKLWAITRRGAKKDFWDLHFLLKQFELMEMLTFFRTKYPSVEPMMVARSLAYFVEAEEDEDPKPILAAKWGDVKEDILVQLRRVQFRL